MNQTDWSNLFKIRIANPTRSMNKHEIVKLLLVMKLLELHKKEKSWIRVYTEFNALDNKRCDIYYENIKDKSIIIYEIQKNPTVKWNKKIQEAYKDYHPMFMKTVDLIVVDLKNLSNNIEELDKQLEDYIV